MTRPCSTSASQMPRALQIGGAGRRPAIISPNRVRPSRPRACSIGTTPKPASGCFIVALCRRCVHIHINALPRQAGGGNLRCHASPLARRMHLLPHPQRRAPRDGDLHPAPRADRPQDLAILAARLHRRRRPGLDRPAVGAAGDRPHDADPQPASRCSTTAWSSARARATSAGTSWWRRRRAARCSSARCRYGPMPSRKCARRWAAKLTADLHGALDRSMEKLAAL